MGLVRIGANRKLRVCCYGEQYSNIMAVISFRVLRELLQNEAILFQVFLSTSRLSLNKNTLYS